MSAIAYHSILPISDKSFETTKKSWKKEKFEERNFYHQGSCKNKIKRCVLKPQCISSTKVVTVFESKK
jgi:hypothetical protein